MNERLLSIINNYARNHRRSSSPARLVSIYHLLREVVYSNVPGDICEFGCYQGGTASVMQVILDYLKSPKDLHLYDSFAGLPPRSDFDGHHLQFNAGDLHASPQQVRERFTSWGLRQPHLHRGWFADTVPTELPERIAFAHVDADLYEPTLYVLEQSYSRLSPGAIVVIDDYDHPALPGIALACQKFLAGRQEELGLLYADKSFPNPIGHVFFRKLPYGIDS